MNLYFILFLIIFVLLFKNRKEKYLNKFNSNKEKIKELQEKNDKEEFVGNNILDINYIEKDRNINGKSLYTINVDPNEKNTIPIIYTNYKYSLEYKLGYEISKIFRIRFQESKGLYNNLSELAVKKNKNSQLNPNILLLVSEVDYLDIVESDKKENLEYSFVCSFYYMEFMMLVRPENNIDSWSDIINYREFLQNDGEKITKLRVGITESYQDAKKFFGAINIDIDNNNEAETNIVFIKDTEKNLFNRLKEPLEDNMAIDTIFITTSYKNPYLEEYLKTGLVNLFTLEGLNIDTIKQLYNNNVFNSRIDNYKYTDIIKKKNFYSKNYKLEDNFRVSQNSKEDKIIGVKMTNAISTRLILLAHNKLDKDYVKFLLRNIYGSIDILKKKLNDYLLDPIRRNYLYNPLEPYDMAYIKKVADYHPGAYEFYKEVQFICDEKDLKKNIHYKKNKYFSRLYQQ